VLSPNIVPDFTRLRVAVVGDLIADHYLYAQPTRLSREAPVMVLRYQREEYGAGGAANVARNLWAFGARTALIGVVGEDERGDELRRILENELVDVSHVRSVFGWSTPTKTRILGAEPGRTMHQMLRIDREPANGLQSAVADQMAETVSSLAGQVDALIVSDYGYGLVGEAVAGAVQEVQRAGALCVLDPRRAFAPFNGVDAMTPNLAELARAVGSTPAALGDANALNEAAGVILNKYGPRLLLVTLGNQGMALYSGEFPEGVRVSASGSEDVIDVSGAGDTAAAAFTLALAAGLEGPRAMRVANAASGIVVMENGTAVCDLSRLRSALPRAPRPGGLLSWEAEPVRQG